MIMSLKQWEKEFKPKGKLNHNIYTSLALKSLVLQITASLVLAKKIREFKMLLPRRQLQRQNWQLVKIGKTTTLHGDHALFA